jgi:hypothetical protein
MTNRLTIRTLLIVIALFAALFAIPRSIGEIQVSRGALVLVATLHQMALASLVGFLFWHISGQRRAVAAVFAVIILIAWGPNLAAGTELALSGESKRLTMIANAMGITNGLSEFYGWTYKFIGYKMTITPGA